MAPEPFSMRIFFADGTPEGIRFIARTGWTGRALVIPRPLLAANQDLKELAAPGIYLLVGQAAAGAVATLQIGAAESLTHCLAEQDALSDAWSWALVSTSKREPFLPEQSAYLVARLVQLAVRAGRCELLNTTSPTLPALAGEQQSELEQYLALLLSVCPPLGLSLFASSGLAPRNDVR